MLFQVDKTIVCVNHLLQVDVLFYDVNERILSIVFFVHLHELIQLYLTLHHQSSEDTASEVTTVRNEIDFRIVAVLQLLQRLLDFRHMLMAERLVDAHVMVNAITGSTGAGVKPGATSHFSWRNNNMSIYKPFCHQHVPEIKQSLKQLQNSYDSEIDFIPYRGDFPRGIFATLVVKCKVELDELVKMYEEYYAKDSFVHIVEKNIDLKQVVNTNKCLIHLEKHGDKLMIISCVDNLLKGASGQAVHNMNLMFNLEETVGLRLKPSAF